ncbi:hypothetical protein Tco_0410128 [Tanacetum coccineum]
MLVLCWIFPSNTKLPTSSLHQVTPIISTVQQTTPILTSTITTDAPTITTAVLESNALTAVELRVAKLEKDVSELKTSDHSSVALAVLYLSKILKIKKEQAESQKNPQFTIKSTDKAALEEYDLKSALYQSMHTNKSFNRNPANHRLYHALMEALIEDENAMDKGVTDTVKDHKRKHDDDEDDDDEDPPAGPNQGKKTKRRRTKESESSKKPSSTKETPKGKTPTKGSKTGKSTSAKELVKELIIEQPPRPPTLDPEWNKQQVVLDQPAQPWFNQMAAALKDPLTFNDLMATPIDFSNVSVKKLHGYGHLEEIVVKISDQQLYTFKEGDFVDLHLNDIEDMLLLAVQHKLFHLNGNVIVDFIVALRMFTRSLILNKRVIDLQLGVESYQKKLNFTKPQKTFPEIEFKEPYTPSYDPPRIVYEDLNKQKRVLRADEQYKFSDGTLKSVRDEIRHRVLDFRLDYNTEMPKRKWTAVDRRRSGLMVELIDKQLREREIIKNLERLVVARELEMDYKLMTRTV